MAFLSVALSDDAHRKVAALARSQGIEVSVYVSNVVKAHVEGRPEPEFPKPRLTGRERQILELVIAHADKGINRAAITGAIGCAYGTLQVAINRLRSLDAVSEDVGEPIGGRPCFVYRPGPRAPELLAREPVKIPAAKLTFATDPAAVLGGASAGESIPLPTDAEDVDEAWNDEGES
jgi:hypothetical protein